MVVKLVTMSIVAIYVMLGIFNIVKHVGYVNVDEKPHCHKFLQDHLGAIKMDYIHRHNIYDLTLK